MKPPPSDRLWLGFTEQPEVDIRILPLVADKAIKSEALDKLMRKKILEVITAVMVKPNMDDYAIPAIPNPLFPYPPTVDAAPAVPPAVTPTPQQPQRLSSSSAASVSRESSTRKSPRFEAPVAPHPSEAGSRTSLPDADVLSQASPKLGGARGHGVAEAHAVGALPAVHPHVRRTGAHPHHRVRGRLSSDGRWRA